MFEEMSVKEVKCDVLVLVLVVKLKTLDLSAFQCHIIIYFCSFSPNKSLPLAAI